MGKITHADIGTQLTKTEWEANTTHLDSQGNTLEVSRSATLVVAASDASAKSKAGADYVCDGVDDQVEIQSAIDALPAGGGLVQLSEGNYSISATIVLKKCVGLVGTLGGKSASITLANNSDCDMIAFGQVDANSSFIYIGHMALGGNGANQASGNGINLYNNGNNPMDCMVDRVYVNGAKETGIKIVGWGHRLVNSLSESCLGDGFYLDVDEFYMTGCFAANNTGRGFYITGSYIHVSDSFALTNKDSGFVFWSATQVIVSGCQAHSNSQSGALAAHNFFFNSVNWAAVSGCVSRDTTVKVDVGYYIMSCDYFTLTGSVAVGSRYGVKLASANAVVVGNFLSGSTAAILADSVSALSLLAYKQHSDLFMDVLAASATHVRSGQDLSLSIPITFTIDAQPDVPRTISWAFVAHTNITAYTMEIKGKDAKGNIQTVTWDETAGWSGETNVAFAIIEYIKMTARTGTGAGDTMNVGIASKLGLSNVIYATGDVYKIKKNNANVSIGTVNVTYGTVDCATITAGDDFTIWFRSNLNIVS